MARYSDTLVDQNGKPVAGAIVTIITKDGQLAVLTNDSAGPISNPFIVGDTGFFYFNAIDAVYDAQFRFGGRLIREDEIIVGEPPAFVGPPGGSNNTRANLAQLKAAATTDLTSLYDGSLWTWTLGDFTGKNDDINIVKANSTPIAVGAWVRQAAKGITTSTAASVEDSLLNIYQSTSDVDNMQGIVTDLAAGVAHAMECYGDSTMWGALASNTANQANPSTPQQLQNTVNLFHGNTALTVRNYGISGTTLKQALAGTDGSSGPLAQRLAASNAVAAFFNYGVNDAFGGAAYGPDEYRNNLILTVRLCRQYNIVPVLITPFPTLAIGAYGSQARVSATAKFAQIMRQVAADMSVILVDNHRYLSAQIENGRLPRDLFPDGVHGEASGTLYTQAGAYAIAGSNLVEALLGPAAPVFRYPGQIVGPATSFVQATHASFLTDTASKSGATVVTTNASGETMRIVFKVDAGGMDIAIGQLLYSSAAATVNVSLNGYGLTTILSLNQYRNEYGGTNPYQNDAEVVLAYKLSPGFYILNLTTASNGAATLNYLRSRANTRPSLAYSAGVQSAQRQRMPSFELSSNSTVLFEEYPTDWFTRDFEIKYTAQLVKPSGFIIGGYLGTLSGTAAATPYVIVGIDGGGNLGVWERTGYTTPYTFTTLDSTKDYSAASHDYVLKITTGGVLSVTIDGVAATNTYTLTSGIQGGVMGVWRQDGATTPLTLSNVERVWRSV